MGTPYNATGFREQGRHPGKVMIVVRMDEETFGQVKAYAETQRHSMNRAMLDLIEFGLQDVMED